MNLKKFKMLHILEKNKKLSIILTIIIAGLIFYVSTITFEASSGKSTSILSIAYHFGIFFLFSLFLLITIKGENETEKKHILIVLLISLAYAGLDEFHQMFVFGRNSSIKDVIIDFLGSLVAVSFYEEIKKLFNKL